MHPDIFDIEFNPNKYLAHWDRLNALAQGNDASPVTLELDVSSACDHRCQWCVDPPGIHTGIFMPLSTARRILHEAKAIGVKGVVFKGGGECTLHPDFPQILRIADEIGFEVGMVTHGGHLTTEIVDAAADGCEYVRISVVGPTPESRKDIHGVDDLASVIAGTRRLISRRGSKRHPIIGLTFCLDYKRHHLIGRCLELGELIKPDYLLIRPPFCEEVGFPAPHTPEEAAMLREEMLMAAEGCQGEVPVLIGKWIGDKELENKTSMSSMGLSRRDINIMNLKYNGIEHLSHRCPACSLLLVVTAGREVYGCCCLRGIKEFMFGKIDHERNTGLWDVMSGDKHREALDRMKRAECLKYCTHPLSKPNEIIEYLSRKDKYHSSFI